MINSFLCWLFGHREFHGHLPSYGGPDCIYPLSVCGSSGHLGWFCLRCNVEWV